MREELKLHDFYANEEMDSSNKKQSNNTAYKPPLCAAEKTQLLHDYELLQSHLIATRCYKRGNLKLIPMPNGSLKTNPATLHYLLWSWNITNGAFRKIKNCVLKAAISRGVVGDIALCSSVLVDDVSEKESTSIIDNLDFCEKFMTAKHVYVQHRMSQLQNEQLNVLTVTESNKNQKRFSEEYENLDKSSIQLWECERRKALARQPFIASQIMEILRKDVSISYYGIANEIDHWCSHSTIRRWVITREGYRMYTERVIPLLNLVQKGKHFKFAKRLVTNWGKGKGKYLLIHYDEKWFWGMLFRKTAKSFDELPKATIKAYHKCHISKTMGVAVVGIAFQDSLENGGNAFKLRFERAQSAKVAQRLTKNKNGDVLRKKGDVYLVDCAVTGSSYGTSTDPKFPLKPFFELNVFPAVKELVKVGGEYEGYQPVFQGDNAGPHINQSYDQFVRDYCKANGWLWELQGP